jgi:hypothetical protein
VLGEARVAKVDLNDSEMSIYHALVVPNRALLAVRLVALANTPFCSSSGLRCSPQAHVYCHDRKLITSPCTPLKLQPELGLG